MTTTSPKIEIKSRREAIGDWSAAMGLTVLASAAIALVVDLFLLSPGMLTAPTAAYLAAIGAGVGLRILGAAIPGMKFNRKIHPIKPAESKTGKSKTGDSEPEVELVSQRPLVIRQERYRIG